MANHCISVSHPEIQELAKITKQHPAIVAAKAAIWQEKNNTLDRFPTSEELRSSNQVNYSLKAVDILISDKAKQVFEKGIKNNWPLDKILTELQIPKEQKAILLNLGSTNREELLTSLLADYSYSVEINTMKNRIGSDEYGSGYEPKEITDKGLANSLGAEVGDYFVEYITEDGDPDVRVFKTLHEAEIAFNTKRSSDNSNVYSNLTVPGGTNYTENEISTPLITPSIKGHAQFSTDNGIGWFRSDEKGKSTYDSEVGEYIAETESTGDLLEDAFGTNKRVIPTNTKTRRILEVQSDLFQKGRDKSNLIDKFERNEYSTNKFILNGDTYEWVNESFYKNGEYIYQSKYNKALQEYLELQEGKNTKENQFLQLLNKDNNWVTFFIKSIIQDSAKKGYEKVLFPSGNTASKVEGHTTLEEFKKQKEDRIKELENKKAKLDSTWMVSEMYDTFGYDDVEFSNEKDAQEYVNKNTTSSKILVVTKLKSEQESINTEINQLKQELERVEGPEGFGALRPIYNFYENTVANILKKTYPVNQVTDEYGNTWNEVTLDETRDNRTILANQIKQNEVYENNRIWEEIFEDIFDWNNHDQHENSTVIQKLLDNNYIPKELISLAKSLQKKPGKTQISKMRISTAYMEYTYGGGQPSFINIDENISRYDNKEEFARSYLHEVLHHYLVYSLSDNTELFTQKMQAYYKETLSLYKGDKEAWYGLKDVHEFISEIMTNEDFVKDLRTKKPDLWTRILNAIRGLLGLSGEQIHDNVLREVITYINKKNKFINKLRIEKNPANTKAITLANVKPAIDKKLEDAVNKNIDNLTQRIAELMPLRGGDSAQSAKLNIFKLKDKLRELSEERTYEKLAEVAYYQLEEAKRILKDPNLSAFELNEVKRIIIYTQNFDAYLQDAPKDLQEKKKNIRDLNVALNVQFQEKLLELAFNQSKITGLEYSKEELDKAYVDVSGIEAGTLAPEYSPIPLAKIIGRSIDLMNRKTSEDFNTDFKDELNKLLKELGKKKFETSDFSEIMEDNKLILEFSSKYFKDEKELWAKHSKLLNEYKKDDKLKAQVADSFNQIFKWYKDNLDYYITSESIKKYKEDLADFKKAFLNSNGEEDARTAEAVQKWQAVNSPYLMLGYTEDENGDQTIDIDSEGKVKIVAERLASTKIGDKYYKNDNWHKYLKARPRPQYLNPKWAKASKNPLHIFMLEKYVEAIKMLPRKVAADIGNYHRFLDNFSLEVTASDNRLKKLVSGIKNISEETFKIQVNQAMVDGGIIKKIVKSDGTIEEEFKPLLRTKDERGNPKPQITHKTIENIKKTQQFKDPMEILQEFYKQAVTYRHKTVVAPMLDLLQYKVETTPGISTNMINQILLDAQGNPQLIENGLINTSGQTRYAINSALSGITRTDSNLGAGVSKAQKEKLKELTDAWVAGGMQGPAPTVSVLSKVKVSDALVDYTRMSLIGLKPFTAATNLMLGLMNNYVYAARGKEFTEKNLDVATKLLFGNVFKFITSKTISSDVKKISNLAEKFGITNTLYESQDPDVAIRAKNKFVKFLFSLQEGGEFLIANQTMIAMMLNAKITSKEGKSSSLWDAYNEEGNLKPEFQTREWSSVEVINDKGDNVSKLNQFRNSLDKIRKRTQGDYQSPMKVKGDWYGRIIMMFRTWVPQAIKERFGRENEDFKGRYTSYADVFSKSFKEDGFKGLFETLGKFSLTTLAKMTNILPLGKYRFDKLDNSAKAAFDEYLDKIGASELDVENMRANIKELQFFLTCTIMILGISGLKGDDDDQTSNFLINIMYRLRQDLTAFVSPGSALSVIKDPLPIMKTIKDVQDVLGTSWDYLDKPESRYYQKGYNKGDLKVWKELQDLLPIYSAVNSTQGVLNTVFNSDSYKYAK